MFVGNEIFIIFNGSRFSFKKCQMLDFFFLHGKEFDLPTEINGLMIWKITLLKYMKIVQN